MSRRIASLVIAVLAVSWIGAPALALSSRWAAWGPITGSANAFRTELLQQSPGFPVATVATDSRAPVTTPAGSAAVLGTGTPPGAKYGTSLGNPYLLLRPRADSPTAPSTTTYTFDEPTPDTGWAFVLGDIDADAVRVSATDAAGGTVPESEIATWYAGRFNYAGNGDLPTWDPLTSTLDGHPDALDTNGASAWFEPDIRLTSLTLTFTRRAGFPVYQTWFASRARPIGGTVSMDPAQACPRSDATLTLLSPAGETLATTTPGPDGTYSFGEYATQADYVVRLDVPDGVGACAVVGNAQQTVSNRGEDNSEDSRADFAVRAIIPQPISGVVSDAAGGVAGVVVTLTAPGGSARTTTTGSDGSYLFDANDVGEGYTISIQVPAGYVAGPDGTTIDDVEVADVPIDQQDFDLVALPSVSGTVTGGGQGVGGVQVVLTPTTGPPFTVATAGDGTYELDGIPPGDYTLSVVAPEEWAPPDPVSITVPDEGLSDQDLALGRLGAAGGTVTRDGLPVADVEVVVAGPDGQQVLRADAEGGYFLDGLEPGTYTVTLRPPTGTVVSGPATYTVVITAAGEIRGGLDFVLAAAPSPTPTPSPIPTTPAPTPTPTQSPSDEPTDEPTDQPTDQPTVAPTDDDDPQDGDDSTQVLPDTGGPSLWLGLASAALFGAGLLLVGLSRRRTRAE